jgi:hypothetical protein
VSTPFNPYAPPAAQVERRGQVGEVFRKGKLVAMSPEGMLPPRCVACNAAAPDGRYARTLYWSPPAWRWSVLAVIVLLFGLSMTGVLLAAIAFWPVMLIAAVANLIVRKKVPLDLAVCARHLRLHAALTWAAVLAIAAVVGGGFFLIGGNWGEAFFALVLVMFALGIARSRVGALAVRVARLEPGRVWLKGTGKAFRDSLPEAADA